MVGMFYDKVVYLTLSLNSILLLIHTHRVAIYRLENIKTDLQDRISEEVTFNICFLFWEHFLFIPL